MPNDDNDLSKNRRRWARFGAYRLDFVEHEVFRGPDRLALPQQAVRILELLVARHGALVTREEIRREIWRDRYVDFEAGLNTAIRKIRRALGDDAANPTLIETAPKRGYRFLATPAFSAGAEREATWRPGPAALGAAAAALLALAAAAFWLVQRAPGGGARAEADLAEISSPGYELYLQGRHAQMQADYALAETKYRAAIDADPEFASAYAALGHVKVLNRKRQQANIELGQSLIDRALEIRPDLAMAHLLDARLKLYYWRDAAAAGRAISQALALAPSSREALTTAAYLHMVEGRPDEALAAVAKAHEMSPLSPAMNADYGWIHYKARSWTDAERLCKTSARLNPQSTFALDCVIHVNHSQGDFAEAADYGLKLMELRGATAAELARLRDMPDARSREAAFWEWTLGWVARSSRNDPLTLRAIALTKLSRLDEAVAAFDAAFDAGGEAFLAFFAVDPRVDELRGHAEFDRLAARSRKSVVLAASGADSDG